MVKVTMEDIVNFRNADDIFEGVDLPLKVAYKLNKMKKSIDTEGGFYSEKFQKIIDEYAKKDDNGNVVFNDDGTQIIIQEDKIEECNDALEDLQKLEVEIDNQNLTIDDFGEDIKCTPEDLELLMPFLS